MRTWVKVFLVVALVTVAPRWAGAQDQPPAQQPPAQQQSTQEQPPAQQQPPADGQRSVPDQQQQQQGNINHVIDQIAARERSEVRMLQRYSPLIETYIQDMRPDKELGAVPDRDHYFLGTAFLKEGVVERSMTDKKRGTVKKLNPASYLASAFSSDYLPEGFLQMIYIDANGFDRQHYHFEYQRREFLGEVRCLIFDVQPLPKSGNGRFKGRIWVEDQNYNIVRFNGTYLPERSLHGMNVHFDSWRVNAVQGAWLPTYVYSEESDLKDFLFGHARFKAQTRLWGYDRQHSGHQEEFSDLKVESVTPVKDQAETSQDRSPIDAERAWNRQAEQNVIDRLETAGLIAPVGEVDKVMETVINNVEVTNNLDVQPEVHCRVLLVSTLESFSIGHTIVMSRGLLDVLPDEASLAAMLTHELGHVMLGHPFDSAWAFSDRTMFPTEDVLREFSFHSTPGDEDLANKKALELLKNSPYKDKLQSVGVFMRQLNAESKQLHSLVDPHLGNRVFNVPEVENSAPQLQPAKLDQIAALPLGARVKVNPWNDRVDLLKSKPAALLSEREKMPFEVTPFYPYLTRANSPAVSAMPPQGEDTAKADLAKKDQQ